MGHIRDQQTEEDVKPLDLACQCGGIQCRSVQQFIYRIVYLPDFHDVDTVLTGRRDLDHVGGRITLFGEYRSYNEKDGERNHLKLYVFVKGISEAGEADQNRIDLIGYICKQPLYRETPLGKEITDILIAVNRKHRKSDYLPAICWYSNARLAAGLPVGTKVRAMGMIQSRIYVKGDSERTAYEVSIREVEVIE